MKILCICPIGIGNYLLAYPAFHLLRKEKDAELYILALRRSIVDIARHDPLWSGIHAIDPTLDRTLELRSAFCRAIANERFTASVSFFPSNNWQYNLLPFLCSIKKRFAFEYPLKKGASLSFLNNHLLPIDPHLHDVNQNVRMASFFLGRDLSVEPLVYPSLFTEQDLREAQEFLAALPGPQTFIGVHPGSSAEHGMEAKRWDSMRFGELANRICDVLKAQVLIFGGPDEERIKHVTASMVKAPCRIIAPQNLRMTAALIGKCSIFLCNDSGLMHIASCMDVPTAAVFGPTDEHRNGPVGNGYLVVRKPMDGFPLWTAESVGVRTLRSGIDPQASLKALTVDDAWKTIGPWLSAITGRMRRAPNGAVPSASAPQRRI